VAGSEEKIKTREVHASRAIVFIPFNPPDSLPTRDVPANRILLSMHYGDVIVRV